jgi:hypothetical protein
VIAKGVTAPRSLNHPIRLKLREHAADAPNICSGFEREFTE